MSVLYLGDVLALPFGKLMLGYNQGCISDEQLAEWQAHHRVKRHLRYATPLPSATMLELAEMVELGTLTEAERLAELRRRFDLTRPHTLTRDGVRKVLL